jgi:DNA-binding LacI/PurR family transcriptional regulator
MHQPIYEMGEESIKLIVSRIKKESNNTKNIILKSNLIDRTSVNSI